MSYDNQNYHANYFLKNDKKQCCFLAKFTIIIKIKINEWIKLNMIYSLEKKNCKNLYDITKIIK